MISNFYAAYAKSSNEKAAMTKLRALFLICLTISPTLSSDPVPFTINTKKWSHVLDDHFISITVNPTDILQGKVYGLAMNSTMAILKGLAPAYVRIGSADTSKYTFKKNRYPSDMVKPEDEYTVTETHWMVFNEVAQSAGLDVVVCLNAAHKVDKSKKWDTRNSLELISFSDSQGYNLTWQLGYEVNSGDSISGIQFGKDLNRLRTILNAFPRYQNAKLIGPDIKVVHKKEDIDFWNDVLNEAGPTLDAVTWHPRWPQPSKMKVSDNSDLGYEFPHDYLEYDKMQLGKILQKNVFKNPIWIGETKTESTGTFAEGLIWARRLVLAAKSGIEVVMKQPNLMDISHPKPEYWIALLHKRLLGKSVLETRSVANNTDLAVISHCTNPMFWKDKPQRIQDGAVTIYAVNMGGLEQKIQIKGTWTGKSQLMFQYVLTSGSDPDSVFSQMTYLNGEPLMMTDDGLLPEIVPRIKKVEKGLTMRLPPYSIGFWVIPEARVKICQIQPQNVPMIHIETPPSAVKSAPKNLQNIQDINQFLVEKLKNPESESEESTEVKIEEASSESTEMDKDLSLLSKENNLPRVARRTRQIQPIDQINKELKTIIRETEEYLIKPEHMKNLNSKMRLAKPSPNMEQRIHKIAEGISDAIKSTNQEHEFNKFLEDTGLKKDFGKLLMHDRMNNAPGASFLSLPGFNPGQRYKRSIDQMREEDYKKDNSEEIDPNVGKFAKRLSLVSDFENINKNEDIFIPIPSDLKGLEDKYKVAVQSKIQGSMKKIDDLKSSMKLNEMEMSQKIKSPVINQDIQEEILKKEIELLKKTEETVADILNSQRKHQEAFKDIIFDELSDVKDDRISALREMYKNQMKNSIEKRQALPTLNKPLFKTVEYIEKNFNLEPESMKKIKRSLEEKMGELLNNFDKRKSMEIKKRMTQPKEEKKISLKRRAKENILSEEEIERRRMKEEHLKSLIRKTPTSSKLHHANKLIRKPDMISKESISKLQKPEEKIEYEDEDDSFELFNKKKLDDIVKPERKRSSMETVKKPKKESRSSRKEELMKSKTEILTKKKREKEDTESAVLEEIKDVKKTKNEKYMKEKMPKGERMPKEERMMKEEKLLKEDKMLKEEKMPKEEKVLKEEKMPKEEKMLKEERKAEPPSEPIPLKNEKERREHMLKQITSMVDSMDLKEDRLKRLKEEDGISEEFEADSLSRKFKRRPRKADITDILPEQIEPQPLENVQALTTEVPVTSTTTESKLRKIRKRLRPKLKNQKKNSEVNDEEKETLSTQKKRDLEKPDFDKKKILKPKLKKIISKYNKPENELPAKEDKVETPEITETPMSEVVKIVEEQTVTTIPIAEPQEQINKELADSPKKNDLLESNPENVQENLEKDVKEVLEEMKVNTDFSGETPTPTEGYIVVEPTTEEGMEDKLVTEKVEMQMAKTSSEKDMMEEKKASNESENESKDSELVSSIEEISEEDRSDKADFYKNLPVFYDAKHEPEDELDDEVEDEPEDELHAHPEEFSLSVIDPESQNTQVIITSPVNAMGTVDESSLPQSQVPEIGQRKRRATFLTHRPASEDEDEEDDYSSEERIKKFKQMIYKKSPAKKLGKNEVHSSGGMGMGADEFIRMAGSTVKVMFDDVIPEAYGQTKSKIQNMGIPEYIKEFGKIVQQMKNLDQIFLNIGEAAVKGYIKGNKEEKGPYIQVISRKKRNAEADDLVTDMSTSSTEEYSNTEDTQTQHQTESIIKEMPPMVNEETPVSQINKETGLTTGSNREEEYARTSTLSTLSADKSGLDRIVGDDGSESGKGIHEGAGWRIPSASDAGQGIEAEKAEVPKEVLGTPHETSSVLDLGSLTKPIKVIQNQIPKIAKRIQPLIENTEKEIIKKTETVSDDLSSQISPWIKTTKDFIRQAFTTLQRQKELSEILASDLMSKEEALRKALGKREVDELEPRLQVYQMEPSSPNRKRDIQSTQSPRLIRQLRGLQPGVYVVPTEEMTNVRSEQIANEANTKTGQPNVVTLNIYYDKKNGDVLAKDAANQSPESVVNQDLLAYYQNKAWNTAAGQYDQNNQYVSPVVIPDLNAPNPLVAPVQATPGVQYPPPETPNPRFIQYPPSSLQQPAVPRYSPVVPNQPLYNPVYYLPSENRFVSQPPGTKRQWREFRSRSSGIPVPINAINNGWNIQYETVPGSVKSTLKPLTGSSYTKNLKLFADKKRSIADYKNHPQLPMPILKFFPTASEEKLRSFVKESEEKQSSEEIDNQSEEKYIDLKKRRMRKPKKKVNKESEEEDFEEAKIEKEKEEEEEERSRKRRSVGENKLNELPETKKIFKRSYPYQVHFMDHDVLPEWFGTYQEVGNSLDPLPTHARKSHIISTPWSDEDEELLAMLDADDELSMVDLDNDDYYYANDNAIGQLKRYLRSRRSTDQSEDNMIKSNMIYKTTGEADHIKTKILGMTGIKNLSDEDSSLELMTKSKPEEKTPGPDIDKKLQDMETVTQTPQTTQTPKQPQLPTELHQQLQKYAQPLFLQQQKLQQQQLKPLSVGQLPLNDTTMLPRNPNDDSLYYFFKYAYDSLVKVMKNMAQLF